MLVRTALPADAGAACAAVRASIVELCVADHQHDAPTLAAWLANKTPENFSQWITSARHAAVVATLEDAVVGFGLLNLAGSVSLLYVAPAARYHGASATMLKALERRAQREGLSALTLSSTTTALSFYRRRGYLPAGPAESGFGVTLAHPLVRDLVAPSAA